MSADYPASVERVHQALRDRHYWQARLDDSGADEATLDALVADADGGVDVRTTQVLRADRLPGVVAQFHRGDLAIVREERWSPVVDGTATAAVAGSIPGAPVALTGDAVLEPTAGGCRLRFTARVEVRIPLVGGKIESFIGNNLVELLIAEQRFTTAWIAAGR